ncbi:rRNA-processing endoribonuclease [Gurleya vavrai]
MINIENNDNFEYNIIFSLLSQKTIKIENPNTQFSDSFLQLIFKLTHNSSYKNNIFSPGTIIGGKVKHDCLNTSITDYLIPISLLAPFTRNPFQLNLYGITNSDRISVDSFKHAFLNILLNFGIENVDLKIIKRGFLPIGQGEIYFSCDNVWHLNSIEKLQSNIQKIRGLAISAHINASTTNLIVNYVKEKLSDLTGNIKLYCDIANKKEAGPSPGYQIVIFGESNKDCKRIIFGESLGDGRKIENVADDCIIDFLKSVEKSGSYDYRCNKIVFAFMCLNLNDVSSVELVSLEKDDFDFLEILKVFFDFKYELRNDGDKIIFSAFGCGYKNYFKVVQ